MDAVFTDISFSEYVRVLFAKVMEDVNRSYSMRNLISYLLSKVVGGDSIVSLVHLDRSNPDLIVFRFRNTRLLMYIISRITSSAALRQVFSDISIRSTEKANSW